MLGCITSRVVQVALEAIEIDDGNWRFELGEKVSHGGGVAKKR
jgi:hypothetical protein